MKQFIYLIVTFPKPLGGPTAGKPNNNKITVESTEDLKRMIKRHSDHTGMMCAEVQTTLLLVVSNATLQVISRQQRSVVLKKMATLVGRIIPAEVLPQALAARSPGIS